MKFELRTPEDRRRAYNTIMKLILNDLAQGRIPTYHILRLDEEGGAANHYMTPVSLEPVNVKGNRMIWVQDYEFFLRLLLRLKRVVEVAYDPGRPAVVFTYMEEG